MWQNIARGVAVGAAGSGLLLARSPVARSVLVRLLSRTRHDAARSNGVRVRTNVAKGSWNRLALIGNLSRPLSEVAGRNLEAVVYAHFGGFDDRPYAAFVDPESPYYQAWVGAYVVFAPEGPAFGFDESGKLVQEAAYQLLEADQRLVLRTAGLFPADDPRPRVRPVGEPTVEPVIAWAGNWWRFRGRAETYSTFAREGGRTGWRGRWLYGVVPADHAAPVDDYHPITVHGSLWLRHDANLGATLAKFYVYAEYADKTGAPWQRGQEIRDECEELMDGIRFDRAN